MKKFQRIVILQETTMKLVAENSLVGLSMRQVSELSGINQSMIYRDFGSKEKLLRSCYDSAKAELKDVFQKIYIEDIKSMSCAEDRIRKNWDKLTGILIDNDYRTIYLCEYRERHMKNTGLIGTYSGAVHERSVAGAESSGFLKLVPGKRDQYFFASKDNVTYYRDVVEHFVETAIIYSKKVLRGEIRDLPQNREKVWKLLRGIIKTLE